MIPLIIAGALVVAILLGILVAVPMVQQRRLLRARDHFAGRLLAAQDRERAAIARELHDDMVQRIYGISSTLTRLNLEAANPLVPTLEKMSADLRAMAHGLHPSVVDNVGLGEALRQLTVDMESRQGCRVRFTDTLGKDNLPHATRLALFRVAQEALNNAIKHADVDTMEMELRNTDGTVVLTVTDHGAGFDPQPTVNKGIGLTSMQERLTLLGGTLQIDSAPGEGTVVRARLPQPTGVQ